MSTQNRIVSVAALVMIAAVLMPARWGAAATLESIPIDNSDFENGGGLPNGLTATVNDWTEETGAGEYLDTGLAHNVDSDTSLYLNDINGAINQDIDHNWSSSEIYQLDFIAFDAAWKVNSVGDGFVAQLREADGTVLWDSGPQLVDGTTTGGVNNLSYTGTGHIFSWTLDGSTFAAVGGAVEGSQLNLRFTSTDAFATFGSSPYIDDVAFSIVVPTPAAMPAGLALLGLAAMRRRRM